MTGTDIRRKLAEGIVRLVEDLIDYKTEVSIGGFVKITADKCNVFPITLREYKKKPCVSKTAQEAITDDREVDLLNNEEESKGSRRAKKRKIYEQQINPNEKVGSKRKKAKSTKSSQAETESAVEDEKSIVVHRFSRKLRRKPAIEVGDVANTEELFPCVLCRKETSPLKVKELIFPSEHRLLIHGRTWHRNEAYKCMMCDQAFKSFFKLHNHSYQMHSKTKNYSCKICDKRFTWAAEMRQHSKVHGSVIYKCMKCPWPGRLFYSYSKYSYHVKTGHRKTKCKKCEEVFKSKDELKSHFREVHIARKIKRKNRKLADIIRGKTVIEVQAKEVPEPQIGLSDLDKDLVFVTKGSSSKTGKETKVIRQLTSKCSR